MDLGPAFAVELRTDTTSEGFAIDPILLHEGGPQLSNTPGNPALPYAYDPFAALRYPVHHGSATPTSIEARALPPHANYTHHMGYIAPPYEAPSFTPMHVVSVPYGSTAFQGPGFGVVGPDHTAALPFVAFPPHVQRSAEVDINHYVEEQPLASHAFTASPVFPARSPTHQETSRERRGTAKQATGTVTRADHKRILRSADRSAPVLPPATPPPSAGLATGTATRTNNKRILRSAGRSAPVVPPSPPPPSALLTATLPAQLPISLSYVQVLALVLRKFGAMQIQDLFQVLLVVAFDWAAAHSHFIREVRSRLNRGKTATNLRLFKRQVEDRRWTCAGQLKTEPTVNITLSVRALRRYLADEAAVAERWAILKVHCPLVRYARVKARPWMIVEETSAPRRRPTTRTSSARTKKTMKAPVGTAARPRSNKRAAKASVVEGTKAIKPTRRAPPR